MYFISTSKYMVFGSRLLTGIGWSAGTVVFGELARTSTKSERTRVYSLFMSMRQFGLILGPSFNLFLRVCNFRIGPFIVDSYTSPGLFMMIVWIIIELMFLFTFFNLPPVGETEEAKDIENSYKELKSNRSSLNGSISEQNIIDVTEVSPLLKYSVHLQRERQVTIIDTSHKTNSVTTCYGCITSVCQKILYLFILIKGLVYEESVLLLSILFIILFDDLVIETGLVPMAESLMNWNEIQTSVFFMIGAVINIISLILVWRLNNRIPDRWLILFGVCLEFLSIIWLLVSFGSGERKVSPILSVVLFSIGFFSMITSLPFSWVICSSLYSKILPMNIQGFGQGVRRSFESLAAVMGPLWAGAAFDLSSSYYPFYGVPLALVVMIIIMLLLSFKRLKSPQRLPIF